MIPQWLSLVDVAFVAVALLCAMMGFQKGFAAQIAHIVTFLAFGVVLFFAYPAIFMYMGSVFRNMQETYLMWLLLFGVSVLAALFYIYFKKLLASMLKAQISDRSDRFYGLVLGFIRGTLMALFIMIFAVILGPPRFYETLSGKSFTGKFVCYELVPRIQPHLTRPVLEEKVNKWKAELLDRKEGGKLD